MSHHVICITGCAQNVLFQHERKRCMLMPLAKSTLNNRGPRAALAVDALFQFFNTQSYNDYD